MAIESLFPRAGNWGAVFGGLRPRKTGLFAPVRKRMAMRLERLASWLCPDLRSSPNISIAIDEYFKLPGITRADFDLLTRGKVKVRYKALDPIWHDRDASRGMIDLHEHIRRSWLVLNEFSGWAKGDGWDAVAQNLHLAACLTDVFANTDLDGSSMWCRSAAAYERANEEVTVKHLAGLIVFNLVWTAYECAVEVASKTTSLKIPRGAKGRDLLSQLARGRHFPYLKVAFLDALDVVPKTTDLSRREMRIALAEGFWPAAAAEHLRQFRNRVVHGEVSKPQPGDWEDEPNYSADDDPAIRQFPVNIRLTMMLIQILATTAVDDDDELNAWSADAQPAGLIFQQLHCKATFDGAQFQLPFDEPLLPDPDF